MVHRVLIAVDGSQASNAALEIACGLADKYEAALGLVTVVEPEAVSDDLIHVAQIEGVIPGNATYSSMYAAEYGPYTSSPSYQNTTRSDKALRLANMIAETTAAKAHAYSAEKPFKAIKTFVADGEPAKAILQCAEENKADIIIMGHDKPKWYKAPFKKSVSKKVQSGAKCPVLVYAKPSDA